MYGLLCIVCVWVVGHHVCMGCGVRCGCGVLGDTQLPVLAVGTSLFISSSWAGTLDEICPLRDNVRFGLVVLVGEFGVHLHVLYIRFLSHTYS
jgi:hypothetical protein